MFLPPCLYRNNAWVHPGIASFLSMSASSGWWCWLTSYIFFNNGVYVTMTECTFARLWARWALYIG